MPTGYTANLCERDEDFKTFVCKCARAFGALMELRDEPLNAPLPEKLGCADDYYGQQLIKAKVEYEHLISFSSDEKQRFGLDAKQKAIQEARESLVKREATVARLLNMQSQVTNWTPPSIDHKGLKDFMLEQLDSTLKFDGDVNYSKKQLTEVEASEPESYYVAAVSALERNIKYYAEEQVKELERLAERNDWLQKLRVSLMSMQDV